MINHHHSKGMEGVVGSVGLKLSFVEVGSKPYHQVVQIHVTQSNDSFKLVHSRFSGR